MKAVDSMKTPIHTTGRHPLAIKPLKFSLICAALLPANSLRTDSLMNSSAQPAMTQ